MPILESFIAGPYNVALTTAVVVGLFLAIRAGHTGGFPALAWRVVLVAAVTGGLIGSTFIFLDFHAPRLGEKSNLGGLIAGVAVVILLARWLHLGARRALDVMALPTLVAMAIGRVGCFLSGCCAGTHTGLPWGVHVDGDAEAIHPVQLYETVADLLLAGALARWVSPGKPGQRIGIAVLGYAGIRFATEFVRAGRTSVAGLNPVQWSVLAIGVAVAIWMWRRAVASPVHAGPVLACAGGIMPHTDTRTEARAFVAALLVMAALMAIILGSPASFAPFERVFLVTAAAVIGGYAMLRRAPGWLARPLARPLVPSLGALLVFNTAEDSTARKREILVGGGIWSGAYSAVVGEDPYTYTDCDGVSRSGSYTTYARRRSTTGWLSGGVRQRTNSGKRVTVEGQLLVGTDKLQSPVVGPTYAPVGSKTSILAGGGTLTVEGRNQHLRVNVLTGNMSKLGTESTGITGSVTARTGVEGGFFMEGNLTPAQWYPTTGDFTYAGMGYMLGKQGARVLLGYGAGAYAGVHVPVRGFEIDLVGRSPANTSKMLVSDQTLSLNVKKVFTRR